MGPVIGRVTSTSAMILMECDGSGLINCTLTDRLTGDRHIVSTKLHPYHPHGCITRTLNPGRIYDLKLEVRTQNLMHIPSSSV